ncbi:hypothetical protein ABZ990_19205 [Streptomyces sp. NPDC046203]|uniref:hypothetical protein n=1 Tax=Streptomyces sp. NPDC046203 TaxID=3154602 RepID=UPI00340DC44C
MKYFEDNPEIFAALVAAIAILGGLLGSIIGAKIQANGGRDQAAAAREAAWIAAEAQRVAALWSVRQLQAAQFVRSVRELRRLGRLYGQDPNNADLRGQGRELLQAVTLKGAEIELTAPDHVVAAAKDLVATAVYNYNMDRRAGPVEHAEEALVGLCGSADEETAAAAHRAHDTIRPQAPVPHEERLRLLLAVPGLSVQHAHRLANDPEIEYRYQDLSASNLERALSTFVAAVREVLRSEDDVAPTAPVQHR